MALYHFSARIIARSAGRSAVAAAAYRSGSRLQDERQGRGHDFTAKPGVVHAEILLPEGAPARFSDRATLWNAVEAGERRRDAQLAREVEFALPRELTQAEGIALAREFVQAQFVSRGMIADLAVHAPAGADGAVKPHAHVMLTLREVGPDGFGAKVRDWNGRGELCAWREAWAEHVNARLAELGHEARVDHRSLAEQGVAFEPQHKIGPAGARREARGEAAERAAEHRAIAHRNGERIAADPGLALAALTQHQATFTRQDLARLLHRHSDGAEQFADLLAKVEAAPELVGLGRDARGQARFTTREMLAIEARMERAAEGLSAARGHAVGARSLRGTQAGQALGDEQAAALAHVTGEADLALVIGFAGTGKSTMLGAARAAWEAQGYRVRGAALSGIAAEGLEAGSSIASGTLASLEYGWARGRDELSRNDVLVVDEAGLVGSRQMERVLGHARDAGAKVVLVGDPEQLQAIEAGAPFRALVERHGAAEITQVRRQRDAWQRAATEELATGRTAAALARYAAAGMVHAHATQAVAREALVAGWAAERAADRQASRLILAHTRTDVAELNRLARARMRAAGELGEERVVATERGERMLAPGDRVMFLRNDRELGVKNGSLGRVEGIVGYTLTVRLDGPEGRAVRFDTDAYDALDHGYAATIHKAQGVTVERAHVLASAGLDRHAAYVALTRHRSGVAVHYGRDAFGDATGLAKALGRERAKASTLDYAAGFAARRGLTPASEIVLPPRITTVAEQATGAGVGSAAEERRTPRRGAFAGLKLGPTRVPEKAVPEQAADPERTNGRPADRNAALDRLAMAVGAYTRAHADVQRMPAQGLPVLPHQTLALERAAAAIERLAPGGAGDLAVVLANAPGLAPAAATVEGRVGLMRLMATEARVRRDPVLRAERYAARWARAEREASRGEGAAGAAHAAALERMARSLAADPEARTALRARAEALGIAAESRLGRMLADRPDPALGPGEARRPDRGHER